MNRPFKAALKTFGALTGAAALYHAAYQLRFPLVKTPQEEVDLEKSLSPASYQTIMSELAWVKEANYRETMEDIVVPYIEERLKEGTVRRDDYVLHYHLYQLPKPAATVLIVHGFNEYKEKFREFVYYFLQQNIQVVVYDARGHGFSKISPQQTQIDSHDFNLYVEDLHAIIETVVLPVKEESPLVLFGHSMGGAVVTAFAEAFPQMVDKLILNTPMFLIDTGKYPQSFTYLYVSLMSYLGYKDLYIPTTEMYDPELHEKHSAVNMISGSLARDSYYHDINIRLHQVPTRGGSLNWLMSAFKAVHQMLNETHLQKIKQPTLLIRAGKDSVVQSEGLYTAGHYLPNVERILLPNSQHQTYLDIDEVIQPYYTKLIEFTLDVSQNI